MSWEKKYHGILWIESTVWLLISRPAPCTAVFAISVWMCVYAEVLWLVGRLEKWYIIAGQFPSSSRFFSKLCITLSSSNQKFLQGSSDVISFFFLLLVFWASFLSSFLIHVVQIKHNFPHAMFTTSPSKVLRMYYYNNCRSDLWLSDAKTSSNIGFHIKALSLPEPWNAFFAKHMQQIIQLWEHIRMISKLKMNGWKILQSLMVIDPKLMFKHHIYPSPLFSPSCYRSI